MSRNLRLSFVSFFITFAILFPLAVLFAVQFARPSSQSAEPADTTPQYQVFEEQDLTFLIAVSKESGDAPDVCLVMKLSPHDNQVTFCSLSPTLTTTVGTKTGTLSQQYEWGKMDALKQAAETLLFLEIDRTALFTDDGVAEVVNSLGGVEMTLKEPIDDGTVSLSAGRQVLDGARAAAVLRYDPAGLIAALGERFTDQLDLGGFFDTLGDCCQTDLSAYDIAVHESAWEQMMSQHTASFCLPELTFETVQGRDKLTEKSKQECIESFGSEQP